jgi:RNase H-fold protein (predicted Holliday junction resolvase)
MPSKSVKNCDLLNSTIQSTFSCLDPDDAAERLKQLRARNKTLKDERDQIGHEYDEMKCQLEKSEADRKQLLVERERLNAEMEYLRRGHEESDILRARVTEIQKESAGFKAECCMLKTSVAKLKTDNEKLTSNLMMAIDEKGDVEVELNDVRSQLREAKRKLDDEINLSSHAKEKAQKEAKQRAEEIARLEEYCGRMESALRDRDDEIDKLENKIVWLEANEPSGSSEPQRVDESGLLLRDSSEEAQVSGGSGDSSTDDSTTMENSKIEDLDDFIDNIQKYRGKGMKEQSANPELLTFGRSQPVHSPSKSTGSRKSNKSPKGRPSMLRRMSTFFFTQ